MSFNLQPEPVHIQALHRSINGNQSAILASIMYLHNDGQPFELDPCFNRGVMYGDLVPWPEKRLDLVPQADGVLAGDFTDLPYDDDSIESICADPPFIVGKPDAIMSEKYGYYEDLPQMMEKLDAMVDQFRRVIRRDGLLVIKCQDITLNRKKYFVSHFIVNTAVKYGFAWIDEYIKTNKTRPTQVTKEVAACRSYHSKFLVFRFRRGRRKYVL